MAPTSDDLTQLTHTIVQRVTLYLEHQGFLVRDVENSYLTYHGMDADPESPTYRIAVGPQQGRKVFTLQTLPDCRPENPLARTVGTVAGFSLHSGVASKYPPAKPGALVCEPLKAAFTEPPAVPCDP